MWSKKGSLSLVGDDVIARGLGRGLIVVIIDPDSEEIAW
jgi:hypothetical protein